MNTRDGNKYSVLDIEPSKDLNVEKAILATCLRDNSVIPDAVRLIRSDDFYEDAHRYIFDAIVGLSDAGKRADVNTVGAALKRAKSLEAVGGLSYLAEIFSDSRHASIPDYAEILREKSLPRSLVNVCHRMLSELRAPSGPPAELLQQVERDIQCLAEKNVVTEATTLREAMQETWNRFEARKNGAHGLPTGFIELDNILTGWQDSELVLVAARPSVGKTALLLNFAWHTAVKQGVPVLFVSLEQSKTEITERLLCIEGRVDSHAMRRANLSAGQHNAMLDAGNVLSESPFHIDDTPGQKMTQIAACARRQQAKHGIRMVFLDYAQLVEPDNHSATQQEQVSQISRRLKFLARNLKIPVIAAAQLNRQSENRPSTKPKLSDLRSSGQLEQDADTVLLLHEDGNVPGVLEINVAKNRNGPRGELKLAYQKQYFRFENFAYGVMS